MVGGKVDAKVARVPSDGLRKDFWEKLALKKEIVEKSALVEELREALQEEHIESVTGIRCLALGSVNKDALLVYQYLYLQVLKDLVQLKHVSLWDPAFDEVDEKIFTRDGFRVEETYNEVVSTGLAEESEGLEQVSEPGTGTQASGPKKYTTLYFMPHIPVDVLDKVISTDKPTLMITNNIAVYGDKWTESQLYEKYPHIALLKNCCNLGIEDQSLLKDTENGFQVMRSKKNRKNKKRFVEPKVEYDYTDCYFTKCNSKGFASSKDLTQVYGTAFSDMALYSIIKKHT